MPTAHVQCPCGGSYRDTSKDKARHQNTIMHNAEIRRLEMLLRMCKKPTHDALKQDVQDMLKKL